MITVFQRMSLAGRGSWIRQYMTGGRYLALLLTVALVSPLAAETELISASLEWPLETTSECISNEWIVVTPQPLRRSLRLVCATPAYDSRWHQRLARKAHAPVLSIDTRPSPCVSFPPLRC